MRLPRWGKALVLSFAFAMVALAGCTAFSAATDPVPSADAEAAPQDGAPDAAATETQAPFTCPLVTCDDPTKPNQCRDDDCTSDAGSLQCPMGGYFAPSNGSTCSVATTAGKTCYLQKTLDADGGTRVFVELSFKLVSTAIVPPNGLVGFAEVFSTGEAGHTVAVGMENGTLKLCEVDGAVVLSCEVGGPLPAPDAPLHLSGAISTDHPETFSLRAGCAATPIVLPLAKRFTAGRPRALVGCKSNLSVTCGVSFDDVVFVSRPE